jgi:hypothetical protein
MPLLFWVVPFLLAGGVMWFAASQMAPYGQEIKLSQAMAAVILMGISAGASDEYLKPLIGYWHYLVLLIVWPFIVMPILHLTFRRSLYAVLIYFVVMFAGQIGMALVLQADKARHLQH